MCVLRWLFFVLMVAILSAAQGRKPEPVETVASERPATVARAH